MYVQVNCVSIFNLSTGEQEWLENQNGRDFVKITDGDSSEVRAIDTAFVVDEDAIANGEISGYVVASNDHPRFHDFAAAATSSERGYWNKETMFFFES